MNSRVLSPTQLTMPVESLVALERRAVDFGESAQGAVNGALGFMASWGYLIQETGFPADFYFGVADGDTVSTFDITGLAALKAARITANRTVAPTETGELQSFPVSNDYATLLRIAQIYFNHPLVPLFLTAVDFRFATLEAQDHGLECVFSTDARMWEVVEYHRITDQ